MVTLYLTRYWAVRLGGGFAKPKLGVLAVGMVREMDTMYAEFHAVLPFVDVKSPWSCGGDTCILL